MVYYWLPAPGGVVHDQGGQALGHQLVVVGVVGHHVELGEDQVTVELPQQPPLEVGRHLLPHLGEQLALTCIVLELENEPSRSLKFHSHVEDPHKGILPSPG